MGVPLASLHSKSQDNLSDLTPAFCVAPALSGEHEALG